MKKKYIERFKNIYLIIILLALYYVYSNNIVEHHKVLFLFLYGIVVCGGFSLIDWYKKK